MLKLEQSMSDVSRTNQIRLLDKPELVAEKLYQYLRKLGKGLESFRIRSPYEDDRNSRRNQSQSSDIYRQWHAEIKREIQRRLTESNAAAVTDVYYSVSKIEGEWIVVFLSPASSHSGWKQFFSKGKASESNAKIFNLVFKYFIFSKHMSDIEVLKGDEELMFVHSVHQTKSAKGSSGLVVWGQTASIMYNYFDILTLVLSRASRRFLPQDNYTMLDAAEVGELYYYENRPYVRDRKRDARRSNSIDFIRFDSNDKDLSKFRKTQLYLYQCLMTELEGFLHECEIAFSPLHFQANSYLSNPYITEITTVQLLEVINNTGYDLTEVDQRFFRAIAQHQGIAAVSFYQGGKTVSEYQQVDVEGEEEPQWRISEVTPWSAISFDADRNYLVLNRQLSVDSGSMAYLGEDGLWTPSDDLFGKSKVDLYTMLKRKYRFLDTGNFMSTQAIDLPSFLAVQAERASGSDNATSVVTYKLPTEAGRDSLAKEVGMRRGKHLLSTDELILTYLSKVHSDSELKEFIEKYKVKISPEYTKVFTEVGIKNWVKESLRRPNNLALPIAEKSLPEHRFYVIYVRSPRSTDPMAVAIEFAYRDGSLYLTDVLRDIEIIKSRFGFLRKHRNSSERLIDGQQYYVDEANQVYVSCYTEHYFTPTLIGRVDIMERIKAGTLVVNRRVKDADGGRLLPLVTYYNGDIKPASSIHNMICFDTSHGEFIQYYVPSYKGLEQGVKHGFRVYHLIGKNCLTNVAVDTPALMRLPVTSLHFNTLTQNILRIRENSQSSLLQKFARVLIEN